MNINQRLIKLENLIKPKITIMTSAIMSKEEQRGRIRELISKKDDDFYERTDPVSLKIRKLGTSLGYL